MALPSGIIPVKAGLVRPAKLDLSPLNQRAIQPAYGADAKVRSSVIPRESLKTTIDNIGQTPRIIYDTADADCYPGTGQTLFDLTTGNHDVALGDTSSPASDDPTFVGTAGDMSDATYTNGPQD